MTDIPSFEQVRVDVPGGRVMTYSACEGDNVLVLAHGGPGMSCDYVRDSHAHLVDQGYRVVSWDQLGCGASDRPVDDSLWTLPRYVEELEAIRKALGLKRFHLLGQSWGAFLALEYALNHQGVLKTLVLEGGAASMPIFRAEQERLPSALGAETVAMMQSHEAEGTTDHPEYLAAIELLMFRHVCRLRVKPDCLLRSVSDLHFASYHAIQGVNEFVFTGNLREWGRLDQLGGILIPVLIMSGTHDLVTPVCAQLMKQRLPDAKVRNFQNSSHVPFLEEPESYFAALSGFLGNHR